VRISRFQDLPRWSRRFYMKISLVWLSLLQLGLAVELSVNALGKARHVRSVKSETRANWGILKNIFGGGSEGQTPESEGQKSEDKGLAESVIPLSGGDGKGQNHTEKRIDIELPDTSECMLNESGLPAEPCDIEKNSTEMVTKFIQADDVVLEVGARYGGVSCQIAKNQQNSGKLVAVEPDHIVWEALSSNLAKHNCNVQVLRGVVGTQDVVMKPEGVSGFGTVSVIGTGEQAVHHMMFDDVQTEYSMQFNVAVVDCEGCLPALLEQNPGMLTHLRLMIIEDHNDAENKAVETLLNSDFELIFKKSRQRVLKRVNNVNLDKRVDNGNLTRTTGTNQSGTY